MNSRFKITGIDPTSLAIAKRLERRERAGTGVPLASASFPSAAANWGQAEEDTLLDFKNAEMLSAGQSNVLLVSLRKDMESYGEMDLIRIKQLTNTRNADSILIAANSKKLDVEFMVDLSMWSSKSNIEAAILNSRLEDRDILMAQGIPFYSSERDALSTLTIASEPTNHFYIDSAVTRLSPLRIYQRPYMYKDVVFIEIDKTFPLSPINFNPSVGIDSYDDLLEQFNKTISAITPKGRQHVVLVLNDIPKGKAISSIQLLKERIQTHNGALVALIPEEKIFSTESGLGGLTSSDIEVFTERNKAIGRVRSLEEEAVIHCPSSGWRLIKKPKPADYGFYIQFNYRSAISKDSKILLGAIDEDFKALAGLRNILRKERRLLVDLGSIEVKDLVAAEYLKVSVGRLSGLHSVIYSMNRNTVLNLGEHRLEVYDDINEARERLKENIESLKHQHLLKAFNVKPLSNGFLFTCNQSGLGADAYVQQEFPRDALIMDGVKGRVDGRAAIILDLGKLEFLNNSTFNTVRDTIKAFKDIPFIVLAEDDFTRLSFQTEGIPVCENIVEGKEFIDDQIAKKIIPPPRGWNYIENPELFEDGFEILFNKRVLGGHIKAAIREDFYALATTTSKKQLAYRNFIINFKSLSVDPDEIPLIKECLKLLDEKKMHYVTLSENAKTRELFTKSKIQVVEDREDAMEVLPFSPIRI